MLETEWLALLAILPHLVHIINQVFLEKENFMHYTILKGPKSQIISRLWANILGQSYSDDVSLSDDQSCKIKVRTRMTLTFSFSQQRKCKTCSLKLEKLLEAFIKIGWVCEFPVVTKFHPWQVQEQRKSLKVSPNFARIETHLRLPPGLTKQTLYHTNISITLRSFPNRVKLRKVHFYFNLWTKFR